MIQGPAGLWSRFYTSGRKETLAVSFFSGRGGSAVMIALEYKGAHADKAADMPMMCHHSDKAADMREQLGFMCTLAYATI